jgi:ATP-dependent protease ClpP protease subunit
MEGRKHKMPKLTRIEVNGITGEVTEFELTDAEIQAMEAAADAHLAEQTDLEAEAVNKATARAQILDRLGLTDEEAKILLG